MSNKVESSAHLKNATFLSASRSVVPMKVNPAHCCSTSHFATAARSRILPLSSGYSFSPYMMRPGKKAESEGRSSSSNSSGGSSRNILFLEEDSDRSSNEIGRTRKRVANPRWCVSVSRSRSYNTLFYDTTVRH